jgi:nucleotide-binding universal stress UspA family protein
MKNILLPTDFSPAAMNAMEYAVQLFKGEPCKFYVVNTYAPVALYTAYSYDASLDLDIGQTFKRKSEEHVQKAIDQINEKFADDQHSFQGVCSFNLLTNEIEELVKDHNIDAIVMGTNGATGLKEVFIGSQTMHVISETKVPVIGVPANFSYQPLKDILFTTDYNIGTDQVGLSLLEALCLKNVSRLVFLNVYQGEDLTDKQSANMDALNAYFKKDAHLTQIAQDMEVLDAVEDFQSRTAIDLLVMVHNKRNFFENLLFKPVIQNIVHRSDVPFLILPPYKVNL